MVEESVRKRIAEALTANPHEDELFREAGRAVVSLSAVENLMAMLFAIVSVPAPREVSINLFYDQNSFERRMNLVNFIILYGGHKREIEAWTAIYKKLQTHKGVRNLIAHQGLFRHPPEGDGPQRVSLRPPWFKKGGRGRELDAKEIKRTGDALKQAAADLWTLIRGLGEPG